MSGPRVAIPQQQNILLWSEDFSNGAWTKNTGATVAANTTDVPDPLGGSTASKLHYDGSGVLDDFRIYQQDGATQGAGEWCCISVWMRVLSGSRTMLLGDNASLAFSPPLTVDTTWRRFSYAAPSGGGPFTQLLAIYDHSGTNAPFDIYLWGGQLVRSNWPGPYVRTTNVVANAGNMRLLSWV